MCIEDKRLGRVMGSTIRQVPVAAGAVRQLCGQDLKRVALYVSTAGGAILWIGPQSAQPAVNAGIPLPTTFPMVQFTVELHGKLLFEPWFAIVGAGTEVCTVIESTLEKE